MKRIKILCISLLMAIQALFVWGFVWHPLSIVATLLNLYLVYRLLPMEKPRRYLLPRGAPVGLLVVLSVALAFHLFQITTLPHDAYGFDAARDILQVRQIVESGRIFILFENFSKEPALYHLAATIHSFVHQEFLALKLAGALAGITGSVLLFLFGMKEFKSTWIATVLGLLYAMSSWQLLMERYIVRPSLVSLVIIPLLYFLLQALRHHRYRDYFWVGVLSSAGMYIYTTYSIVPVIVGFILVIDMLRHKKSYAVATLAAAVVVVLPLISYIVQEPDTYFQRMRQRREEVKVRQLSLKDQARSFAVNYQHSVRGLFVRGASFPAMENTSPGQKAFDTITLLLILSGMLIGIQNIREPRNAVSFLFIVLALVPGSSMSIGFENETPNFQRMIVALPVLLLFVGNALNIRRVPRYLMYLVIASALVIIAQSNFKRIFIDYPHSYPFDNLPLFSAMRSEHNRDSEVAVIALFYIDPEVVDIYMPRSKRILYESTNAVAYYGLPAYQEQALRFVRENPRTPLVFFSMETPAGVLTEGRECVLPYTLASPYGLRIYVTRCTGKL